MISRTQTLDLSITRLDALTTVEAGGQKNFFSGNFHLVIIIYFIALGDWQVY